MDFAESIAESINLLINTATLAVLSILIKYLKSH
jgi:hypothetical protein